MIAISPCILWLKAVKVFICHSYVARLYGLQMVTLPWVVFSRKYQICPNGFGSIREGCHAGLVEEDGMMPLASKAMSQDFPGAVARSCSSDGQAWCHQAAWQAGEEPLGPNGVEIGLKRKVTLTNSSDWLIQPSVLPLIDTIGVIKRGWVGWNVSAIQRRQY